MIEELKEVMEKNKLTLEVVAHEIGVSLNTVFRWLKGKNKPHKVFAKKIENLIRKYQQE